MNFLDHLDRWVGQNKEELTSLGTLSYRRTTDSRPKHSAHLALERRSFSAEILLWDSAEAEFNYDIGNDSHLEYLELESPDELDKLLERWMMLCRERSS